MPFFSVIIPVYNAEKYIKRCIDSVLNQTFRDFEIIVVNNFSGDNTEPILRSYDNQFLTYYNEENHGIIAHSRNYGVSKAKGEWICFLDADDWWHPEKLSRIYEYTSSYDLIFHRLEITGSYNGLMRNYIGRPVYKKDLYKNLVMFGNICPTSSSALKKSLYEQLGGMSENPLLIAVEDSDFWYRLAMITEKWKFIIDPLGYYFMGSNTSLSLKQIDREWTLLNEHIDNLSERERIKAKKTVLYKQARLQQKLGNYSGAVQSYLKSFALCRFPQTIFFAIECSLKFIIIR